MGGLDTYRRQRAKGQSFSLQSPIVADSQTKDVKTITTTSEPEQSFLTRQLDLLQKDTIKDPRQSFRTLPSSTSTNTTNATTGGVVGPMGNTGLGLNLPGVEKAMLEMEGNGLTGEELKEKFARLGRRVHLPYYSGSELMPRKRQNQVHYHPQHHLHQVLRLLSRMRHYIISYVPPDTYRDVS
jgi:hypothetical protein